MSINANVLIETARKVLHPHYVGDSGDRLSGNVAATLVTVDGNMYSGVCIDVGSGIGFCAEHAAIGAMFTAREYKIAAIVAVWEDEQGRLYVLPPCGRCREFIRQIDVHNLDTDVILAADNVVKLRELLPCHEWPTTPVG